MNKLPEFIVVGAAKSGTTSVYEVLIEQESVFIPDLKECRFFSQMPQNCKGGLAAKFQNEGPRTIEEYLELFKDKEKEIKGDISNDYFYYYKKAIKNIKITYKKFKQKEPKILIFLRSPIERVFSMYAMSVRLKSDYLNFIDSFNKSEERIKENYSWVFDLKNLGFSFEATNEYFKNFDKVKVILTEDLNDEKTWEEIFHFLDLNKYFFLKKQANTNHYTKPKSPILMRLFGIAERIWLQNKKFVNKKFLPIIFIKNFIKYLDKINSKGDDLTLSEKDRDYLKNIYSDDISKLGKLIKKELKHWL